MSEQSPNLERLQKIIASAGICSRRKAEELIAEGRVQINGQVVTEPGTKADPDKDHIRVDGKLLQGGERTRYYMVNKPRGYVTTVSDPEKRPTVIDLIQSGRRTNERVFPVGRLDYASEGLQLLTNDGELANSLTRAASHVEKTYLVKVAGKPEEGGLDQLRSGVMIEKGRVGAREGRVLTAPAEIRLYRGGDNPWYEMVLIEGRNREIRKMFEEIGHHVEKIRRIGYGPLVLDVEPGEFRELTEDEVESLRKAVRTGPARARSKAKAREAERVAAAEAKARFEEREAARQAKAAEFGLSIEEVAPERPGARPIRRGPDGRPSSPVRRKVAPGKGGKSAAKGAGKGGYRKDSGRESYGRSGTGRSGAGRSDSGRSDSGRSSFSRPDSRPSGSDGERTGSGRSFGGRSDSPRPTSGRSSYGRPDSGRGASEEGASGRSGYSRSGSSRAGSDRAGSGRTGGSGRSYGDRPSTGRPAAGRSSSDRPYGDRPSFSDRPSGDRPSSGRPGAGRSYGDRPSGDRSSGGRPGSGRPSSGRPSTGRPPSGRPSSGRPSSGRPSSGRPSGGRPGSGRPPRRPQS